jgi:hypothetical protein
MHFCDCSLDTDLTSSHFSRRGFGRKWRNYCHERPLRVAHGHCPMSQCQEKESQAHPIVLLDHTRRHPNGLVKARCFHPKSFYVLAPEAEPKFTNPGRSQGTCGDSCSPGRAPHATVPRSLSCFGVFYLSLNAWDFWLGGCSSPRVLFLLLFFFSSLSLFLVSISSSI